MIYVCLIAMAISCVCAGWQLRGNYEDRRSPLFPIDDVPPRPNPPTQLPPARTLSRAESRRLEIPTIKRQSAVRSALGWEQPCQ